MATQNQITECIALGLTKKQRIKNLQQKIENEGCSFFTHFEKLLLEQKNCKLSLSYDLIILFFLKKMLSGHEIFSKKTFSTSDNFNLFFANNSNKIFRFLLMFLIKKKFIFYKYLK